MLETPKLTEVPTNDLAPPFPGFPHLPKLLGDAQLWLSPPEAFPSPKYALHTT